jgi:hypothetical protein
MTLQIAGMLKKFLLCLGYTLTYRSVAPKDYVTGGLEVKWLVSQEKDFAQPQRLHIYLHGYIIKQKKKKENFSLQQPNSLVGHSKHRFLTPFPFNKVPKNGFSIFK